MGRLPWKPVLASLFISAGLLGTAYRARSALAASGDSPVGSPLWTQFVEASRSGTEPILPDFSYAGYRYSEAPIPSVAGPIFDVVKYGAKPSDDGYDDAGIQAAIDAAEAAGGGVVFLPAGRYLLNPVEDSNHSISIRASRVVLKGAGSGPGGTEIVMVAKKQGGAMIRIFPKAWTVARAADITAGARRETFWVNVDGTSKLRVGQWVVIRHQSPASNDGYFSPLKLDPEWTRVFEGGVSFHEVHSVAEISNNRARFREPLHFTVGANGTANGAQFVLETINPLEEVGIEDIRFTGKWDEYPEEFVHHKDWIHDSGWCILGVKQVVNSWVRRCEFRHVNSAIAADTASATTFEAIRIAGKKGHSSIGTRRGYGLLVKDCEDLAGTHHGPGFGYNSVGTVYLRHAMQVNQGIDSHGGMPHTSLIDQTKGGVLGGNGGPLANHPNHAKYFVFWNFVHRSTSSKSYDFWNLDRRENNSFAFPIFAGFTSDRPVVFKDEGSKVLRNESRGAPVEPISLFEAQLKLRLGG